MRLAALCLALAPAAPVAAGEFHTLEGHGGPVMDIAVSPNDGRIATASFDNALGLWTDRSPRWLDGHAAAVNTVTFTDDGVISGGDDFDVLVWTAGTPARRDGHEGKVMDIAVAPDGSIAASASWDGSVGLWPLPDGPARFLTGHDAAVNAVAFSADGSRLFSAGADGTIRVWDVATGTERRQLVRHGFGINRIVLDEDAGWLAYGAVDGVTRVTDVESGAAIVDLSLDRRPILALAADPQGTQLAIGDGEGFITVVDTTDWSIRRDFRAAERGPIWALAFSPDGTNILAGGLDPKVYSWPIATMDTYQAMASGDESFLRAPETMENGERQFVRKCSICHSLTPGSARRAGPTLYGLFGRPAGSVGDYAYSEALIHTDIVWDDTTIDALFDLGPDHYIPGSKMPMQRITGSDDRSDLIAYLRRATAPEERRE
ncbi:cytochrome c [Tranquillimonas rosea]|uniref:Cytochrome c n=1 Tax=Tranquillimonas rosea TaxID=641238 RepID=A0A1H9WC49_9RHOB|nr:c-type cytochrome [Tranquillimonas rosea]SES31043.1 cytochrome c [Tranquillimonas rosea]